MLTSFLFLLLMLEGFSSLLLIFISKFPLSKLLAFEKIWSFTKGKKHLSDVACSLEH